MGRSIFGALCVFVRFYVGVTLHIIYFWVLFYSRLSLCFNVCGHRELSSDNVQVPGHLLRMNPLLHLVLFVSVWYPPVNFDPNLSFILFFNMKLNPIRVIKKCCVFPLFLVYVFLRSEQMALETDISSKLFIFNKEDIGTTKNAN